MLTPSFAYSLIQYCQNTKDFMVPSLWGSVSSLPFPLAALRAHRLRWSLTVAYYFHRSTNATIHMHRSSQITAAPSCKAYISGVSWRFAVFAALLSDNMAPPTLPHFCRHRTQLYHLQPNQRALILKRGGSELLLRSRRELHGLFTGYTLAPCSTRTYYRAAPSDQCRRLFCATVRHWHHHGLQGAISFDDRCIFFLTCLRGNSSVFNLCCRGGGLSRVKGRKQCTGMIYTSWLFFWLLIICVDTARVQDNRPKVYDNSYLYGACCTRDCSVAGLGHHGHIPSRASYNSLLLGDSQPTIQWIISKTIINRKGWPPSSCLASPSNSAPSANGCFVQLTYVSIVHNPQFCKRKRKKKINIPERELATKHLTYTWPIMYLLTLFPLLRGPPFSLPRSFFQLSRLRWEKWRCSLRRAACSRLTWCMPLPRRVNLGHRKRLDCGTVNLREGFPVRHSW